MILVLGLLALFGAAPVRLSSTEPGPRAQVTLQLQRRATVDPTGVALRRSQPVAARRLEVLAEPRADRVAAYLRHHALLI